MVEAPPEVLDGRAGMQQHLTDPDPRPRKPRLYSIVGMPRAPGGEWTRPQEGLHVGLSPWAHGRLGRWADLDAAEDSHVIERGGRIGACLSAVFRIVARRPGQVYDTC